MSLPSDVLFHRALFEARPDLQRWEYNPTDFPLLRQVQDARSEIFERSFDRGSLQPCLDFVTPVPDAFGSVPQEAIDAFAFPDPEQMAVFIAMTRVLVGELSALGTILAAAAEIQELVGVPDAGQHRLADALFFIGLEFVVGHELGHCGLGHVPDRTIYAEFSGIEKERANLLQRHSHEFDADKYAIGELCHNLLDSECGEALATLLPTSDPAVHYLPLIAMALTGVFLLYLQNHSLRILDPGEQEHPPLVLLCYK